MNPNGIPQPQADAGTKKQPVIPSGIWFAFILVTSLFALWGLANDITNPMVAAFKKILLISHFESSLVMFAFYGGYCLMAVPAALFIKRFTYKSGILVGLLLYALGALLFIPAGNMMAFWAFLIAYFILTCGLSFLETSSNPYILSMGPDETATRRLNFAQAFNPIGAIMGMLIAQKLVLGKLDPADETTRKALQIADPQKFHAMQVSDLTILKTPYAVIGLVVLGFFIVFLLSKLPKSRGEEGTHLNLRPTLKRLFANRKYVEGVITQAFYVGAQIMVWTFIIQYGSNELGMDFVTAQSYNIIAMGVFCISRFICTALLKYFSPGGLLMSLAIVAGALLLGTIFMPGNHNAGAEINAILAQGTQSSSMFVNQMKGLWIGLTQVKGLACLYCLVGVSACMSLMFPTIYGIALKGLGDDAKLGAAGLIMAIGGGSVMPPLQAAIMDMHPFNLGFMTLSQFRASFVLPFICFVVITIYGFRTSNVHKHTH